MTTLSSSISLPGRNNTATDYLNIQSAGVTEENQIFYTDEVEETEEQIWTRKQNARSNPTNQLPDILLDNSSAHSSTYPQTPTLLKLAKPTSMAIEQQNDINLQQLRLIIRTEEHSETVLQQDPRYQH